jgi:hypothetical protein
MLEKENFFVSGFFFLAPTPDLTVNWPKMLKQLKRENGLINFSGASYRSFKKVKECTSACEMHWLLKQFGLLAAII